MKNRLGEKQGDEKASSGKNLETGNSKGVAKQGMRGSKGLENVHLVDTDNDQAIVNERPDS